MVRGVSRVSRLWRMGSVQLSLYLSALWWIVPLSHIAAANHTVAILQDHCQAANFDSNLLQDSLENDITFIKICPPDSETLHGDIFENDDIDVFIGSLNFTFNSEMRKNAELHMKPYVTPYSSLPYSDNSQAFPFSANFVQMSTPLKEILGNFRWKHVVVITVYEEYWMEMGTSLFIGLSEAGFRPSIKYFRDHVPGYDVQDILDGVSTTQKAIVLCVDIGLTRRILQQADAARMATKHAFFLFSLSPYDTVTEDDYSALLNDTSEILESVFIIHPVFEAKLDNTIRDKRSIRDSVYLRGASASVSGSHERVHNVESGSDIHRQRLETEQSEQGDIIKRNVLSLGQRHVRSVGQGDVKRSLSTSSDEELRFYQDAASVIDRVFTIRAETDTSDSSHLFQVLSNTTVSLMSGEQTITQLAEIHFEFHLYDFHDDESEFVKVQQIVYGSIARSTIKWPSDVQLPPDVCFLPDDCQTPPGLDALYILAIAISVLFVAGVATAVIIMVWRKVIHREMSKGHQKVILTNEDLVFLQRKDVQKGSKVLNGNIPEKPDLLKASEKPNRSLASLHEYEDLTDTARYNGDLVHVKELKVKGFEMKSKVFALLKQLREVRHENVNAFIGFYEDQQTPAIISDYCIRGSLADVLQNTDIKLDWDFKLSLLTDLIRGVRFVHNSTLRWHGNLKSRNCVIDSRWVLKVADYGLSSFYEATKLTPTFNDTDLLFTAPEHLRHPAPPLKGSEKGDVYSVALILQCVILRSEPYSTSGLTPKEILQKIRNPPPLLRPSVSHGAAPPQYIQIMKVCWSENPDLRPTIEEIYQQFKTITGGKKTNIVDTMFRMLEKYSTDLEDLVKERTTQLEEEKKKTDVLLYRMLPPTVADNLKIGTTVAAEQFPEVTIYFSDIVGFTTISAKSTPMQVVDLLNGLYTMFDATIDSYDVYKVETIGDAYMVSSGLPLRNGNRHAGEISTMALDLLSQCGDFTIKHMPEVPLRVRIGLHSGSCVAGVVGLTMPRYCLFGDTVNTASRMETTGAAYRIHISQEVKDILDVLGGYHLEYRGEVELKGKGLAKTYWLTGKIGFTKKLPDPPPLAGGDNHGLSLDDFRLGRKISSSVPPSPSEFSGNSKTFNKSGIKNRKDIKSCETPDSPLVRAPREPKHEDTITSLPNAMTSEVPNAKSPPVLYPSVIQGNAVMADKIIEERVNGNATAQQIIHTVTIHSPREAGLTPFSGTTNDKPSHSKVSADGRRRKLPQPNKDAPSRTEAVLQNKKHKAKIGRGSSTVSPSSSPSRLSLSEDSSTSGRKSSSSYHENSSIKLAFEESLV